MRPQRRQPTRLPRPWDSPGKNTGVGFHFLLQCMKVKSESEVTQSCPTLSDPIDCSLPGSSIHGIFQARVLEWGAVAFSVEVSKVELLLFFLFFFFVLLFLIGWKLLYNVLLVSAIHQHESTIGIHNVPSLLNSLTHPPHPTSRLTQSTKLSSLSCHTVNSHWLSILHMVIYLFPCYSLN